MRKPGVIGTTALAAILAAGCGSTDPSRQPKPVESIVASGENDAKIRSTMFTAVNSKPHEIKYAFQNDRTLESLINTPIKDHRVSEAGYKPITILDAVILDSSDAIKEKSDILLSFGAKPTEQTMGFIDTALDKTLKEVETFVKIENPSKNEREYLLSQVTKMRDLLGIKKDLALRLPNEKTAEEQRIPGR